MLNFIEMQNLYVLIDLIYLLFIAKLWNTFHESHQVERACRQSLDNLQLDYIDLYLIHFPFGYVHKNDREQWPRNPDGSRALR